MVSYNFTLAEYRIKILAPNTMSDETASDLHKKLEHLLRARLAELSQEITAAFDEVHVKIVK